MAKQRTWPMRFSDAGRSYINKSVQKPRVGKQMVWNSRDGFWHRGAGDMEVWNQQKRWKKAVLDLPLESLVLDLGAHIGLFSHYVRTTFEEGNHRFLSVEPDQNNLPVLRRNSLDCDEIFPYAVEMEEWESHLFVLNDHPSASSLLPIGGREMITVQTKAWKSFLDYQPYMIKCDIEGAEYLLDWNLLPESVRIVAIEFHFLRGEKDVHEFRIILSSLTGLGFRTVQEPRINRFCKTTTGIFVR